MAEFTFMFDEAGLVGMTEGGGDIELRMAEAGEAIKAEAIRLIRHEEGMPPSGKIYSGNTSPSSAPGEIPMSQSGALVHGIRSEVVPDSRGGMMVRVGSDVVHGMMLEMGTVHMKPRPWLRPAVTKEMMNADSILSDSTWAAADETL